MHYLHLRLSYILSVCLWAFPTYLLLFLIVSDFLCSVFLSAQLPVSLKSLFHPPPICDLQVHLLLYFFPSYCNCSCTTSFYWERLLENVNSSIHKCQPDAFSFLIFFALFPAMSLFLYLCVLKARKTPSCNTKFNMTSALAYSTIRRMRSSSRLCSMTGTWPTAPTSCRTPHPRRLPHLHLSSGHPSSRLLSRQQPPPPQ